MANRHNTFKRGGGIKKMNEGKSAGKIEKEAGLKTGGAVVARKDGGKVPGRASGGRVDKRARGGGVGADKHPFSSAHVK